MITPKLTIEVGKRSRRSDLNVPYLKMLTTSTALDGVFAEDCGGNQCEAGRAYHRRGTTDKTWALEEILSAEVRVHTKLARYPAAKLWYFARSLNPEGSGKVTLYFPEVKALLKCASSTVYHHLKQGKRQGFFRYYRRQGHKLTLYLGGLFKVCRSLELEGWGYVASLPLGQVGDYDCRRSATEIAAKKCQQKARYAAKQPKPPKPRDTLEDSRGGGYEHLYTESRRKRLKHYKFPDCDDVLDSTGILPSSSTGRGATASPYILRVTANRIFTSAGWIPFGVSQRYIASELGVSTRTVGRHFSQRGTKRKQVCQTKTSYKFEPERVKYGVSDDLYMEDAGRLFRAYGKTWLALTNIYSVPHGHLKKMSDAQRKFTDKYSLSASKRAGGNQAHKPGLSKNQLARS